MSAPAATIYKLTRLDGTTHNGFQWSLPSGKRPGAWHETSGRGPLCSDGWLHAYTHPLLAVLLNHIHADYKPFILWRAEGRGKFKDDHGLKCGYSQMRLIKRCRIPQISREAKVRFAIYCAQTGKTSPAWDTWAADWLSGRDRSAAAAYAAYAATNAARPDARAADAAYADAAYASDADAAYSAAATAATAAASATFDLVAIAKRAIRDEKAMGSK